jgi:nucleoside 2-deoxyribosyltransferase
MPKRPIVYLAGPVAGLSYAVATGWRQYAAGYLETAGIDTLSPLRGRPDLVGSPHIPIGTIADIPDQAIASRDHTDIKRCDLVLANFLDADHVSAGTCVEIGWASSLGKPVFVVMEDSGNPHDRALIRALARHRFSSFQAALERIIFYFSKEVLW